MIEADIRELDIDEGDFLGANLKGAFLADYRTKEDREEHEKIKAEAMRKAEAREEGTEIKDLDQPEILDFPGAAEPQE